MQVCAGVMATGRAVLCVAVAAATLCCVSRAPELHDAPVQRVEPVIVYRAEPQVPGALRVAAIFPTLGRYATSGGQSLNGARLAVRDVNEAGGVHGRPVELLEYHTGSYFLDAARAAGLAVADGGALAIVGSNSSSLSKAVAAVAEAHGIVQISNVSTAHDLTWDSETGEERRFVFRVCVSDRAMGRALARFARERLDATRVAVLYEVGRVYSAQLAASFADSFRAGGGEFVEEFFYLPLETDFRSQLEDVKAFGADTLFLPASFTDATLIALQAEALDVTSTLLGADGWSNPLLFSRGGPSRPSYYGDHCDPPKAFDERYGREFGEEANGCRAALAYDAVQAIVAGLRALGPVEEVALTEELATTRRLLRDRVAAVEIQGVAGVVRFDAHGDSRRKIAVHEVLTDSRGTRLSGLIGD